MPEIRSIHIQPRDQVHINRTTTQSIHSYNSTPLTRLEVSPKHYILYKLKRPHCIHIMIAEINTSHIRIVFSQGRLAHQRLTPAQVGCISK